MPRKSKDGKTSGQRIAEELPEWEYTTTTQFVGEKFNRPPGDKRWNFQDWKVAQSDSGAIMIVVAWYRFDLQPEGRVT